MAIKLGWALTLPAILCWSCAPCLPTAGAKTTEVTPAIAAPSPAAVWWSPELKLASPTASSQRLAEAWPESYDVVAPSAGGVQQQVVRDCASYFALRPRGFAPLSQPDASAMKLDGARCEALRAVGAARAARTGSMADLVFDRQLLKYLPASFGPEEMPADRERRESAARNGLSWATVDPTAIVEPAGPTAIRVQGDDWKAEVTLLVRGDLDGDGADDVLIKTVASGTAGSWREIRLRWLTRAAGTPVLRMVREFPL